MARTAYLGSKTAVVGATALDTAGYGVIHFVGVVTNATNVLTLTDGATSAAADTIATGNLINADGTVCDFSALEKDDVVDFFYIGPKQYIKASLTAVTLFAVFEEPLASI